MGNMARFWIELNPAEAFEGQVVRIAPPPTGLRHPLTRGIVIEAADPHRVLSPGMRGIVHVVVRPIEGVLRVPAQAIGYAPLAASHGEVDLGPSPHVWMLRKGKPVPIPVTPAVSIAKQDLRTGVVPAADRARSAPSPRNRKGIDSARSVQRCKGNCVWIAAATMLMLLS